MAKSAQRSKAYIEGLKARRRWLGKAYTSAFDFDIAVLGPGMALYSRYAGVLNQHLATRDFVVGEHADGVTLGLAFARRELTLAAVHRAVLGEEVAC